jgi:hypothetical protein
MNSRRLEVGDEDNTSFALQSSKLTNASVGFDAGEQQASESSEPSGGHDRFQRRKSKEEIPQQSLAERVRTENEEG